MIITHIVYFFKEKCYNDDGDCMKTIMNNINNTYVIKKSKFISFLIKINNEDDAKKEIEAINKKYKDATHICYAYITNNKEIATDNGEPTGTAGIPILNILKKNNLDNILAVVVRYFGGIKLGANGLIRAYSSSINDIVKILDNLLKDSIITYTEFDINVIYECIIRCCDIDIIKNNCIQYKILDTLKIAF